MATIFYPTPKQEEEIYQWLLWEIQIVMYDGTPQKEFVFETSELDLPIGCIQATCTIRAEITMNENYPVPEREVDGEITIKPILGFDEDFYGEQMYVIFMDTKSLESVQEYN